jgi:hypothetical protein
MIAMDVRSEMLDAEIELRDLLLGTPGQAVTGIVHGYNRRSLPEREAFVSVLATHIAIAEAVKRAVSLSASAGSAEMREPFA